MGKNHNVYFDDESCRYIDGLEGKGTLLNQLVKEHFSNTEETLISKLTQIDIERKSIMQKLSVIQNEKARKVIEANKKRQLTAAEQYKVDCLNHIQRLWKEDKISEEDYHKCFGDNGFILSEGEKFL